MQFIFLYVAILLAYAINASATETSPEKSCAILLLDQAQSSNTAILGKTHFVAAEDAYLLPITYKEDDSVIPQLGQVTQIRDFNRLSKGRLVLSTSKGNVVMVAADDLGYSRFIETPFATANAQVLGIKPHYEGGETKRILTFSPETAKVILRPGFSAELPNSARVIAADFTGKNEVTAVFAKRLRVYDYSALAIHKEIPPQDEFLSASVHPYTGKVAAIDGNEVIVFDTPDQRRVIAPIEKGPSSIIWGNHGSRFYVRQGSKLTFYDTSGDKLGEVQLNSSLLSMAWDLSDTMIALSTPTETIIYNIDRQTTTYIGDFSTRWQRVAWSQEDNLLITLGMVTENNTTMWGVQTWDPISGEKLALDFTLPILPNENVYPYLTATRGSMLAGSFRFFIVRQNGRYSDVIQAPGSRTSNATQRVIVPSTPAQRRRLLN